jgi:hypothetical protein
LPQLLTAQFYNAPQNKVWAMGSYVGLDFSSPGDPVVIPTSMFGSNNEGCVSISNGEGGLLFYSNGYRAWTATGALMPHAIDINNLGPYSASVTQAAAIVPDPGNIDRYYLFTIGREIADYGLYCSVVDMSLNGGMGDIDTTYSLHGTKLCNFIAEKMVAIGGCNNNVWLLIHMRDDPVIKAFEVTASGVNTTPVVSTASSLPSSTYIAYLYGVLKVSPAQNKLMACNSNGKTLITYDFDNATGIVSNAHMLDSAIGYYGGTFSPDGSKIYVKSIELPTGNFYQYDLNIANPALSRTTIGTSIYDWLDMKLGPDGKIYFGSKFGYTPNNGSRYAGRINNPNNAGTACGFQDSVTSIDFRTLSPTSGLRIGLPNEVVYPLSASSNQSQHVVLDTIICNFPVSMVLTPSLSSGSNHLWSNGTTASSCSITQEGTYWVKYNTTGPCNTRIDTFKIKGNLPPISILFNNNVLSTASTYTTYQWYKAGILISGATGQTLIPDGDGTYAVKVSNVWGCTDSAAYILSGNTGIYDPALLKEKVSIYPNPATDIIFVSAPAPLNLSLFNLHGKLLVRTYSNNTLPIQELANGIYFLKIEDKNGNLIRIGKVAKKN